MHTRHLHPVKETLFLLLLVLYFVSNSSAQKCGASGCVCDGSCDSGLFRKDWCYINSLGTSCQDFQGYRDNKAYMLCGTCTAPTFCENAVTCPAGSPASTPTCCPSGYIKDEPGNCNKYQTCIPPTRAPTLKPTTASPTREPTPPTQSPTAPPTYSPTFNPTHSPTTSPTGTPTTAYPTWNPTFAPTKEPTVGPSSSPSKNPTRSPTPPTTRQPSKNPTYFPSTSPTHLPSHNPSVSPTKAPVWKDVCSPEDGLFLVNYDNYATQAAKCANTCRLKLIQNNQPEPCIRTCPSFASYTSLCKECMVFFLLNQQKKCSGPCLSNKLSVDCVSCTNGTVRPEFIYCTGLASQIQEGSGNGDGTSGFAPAEIDQTIIAGAAGGAAGFFVLAAAFITLRRMRHNRLVTDQLVNEVSANIFTRNKDEFHTSNPLYHKGIHRPYDTRESATVDAGEDIRGQQFRTRFSFHGIERDELDVDAGVSLTGISKTTEWVLCKDDTTGRIGLIPCTYVNNV